MIMGQYSKYIDPKRRAVPTPKSMVDEKGICAFGTFDKEFEQMDLVKLKKPTRAPQCMNRLKLTLWEATEVHLKNGVLLAVVCDMGIFGKTLNIFYDKRTKKVYCWNTNLKSKDTVIAPNLINGAIAEGKTDVSHVKYVNNFQDGKCELQGNHKGKCLITVTQKDKTIVRAIKENYGEATIEYNFTLTRLSKPCVASIPFGKNRPLYSQKDSSRQKADLSSTAKRCSQTKTAPQSSTTTEATIPVARTTTGSPLWANATLTAKKNGSLSTSLAINP